MSVKHQHRKAEKAPNPNWFFMAAFDKTKWLEKAIKNGTLKKCKATQILQANSQFDEWLEKRPESIKKLAAEFPFGTVWKIHAEDLVIVGWNEQDIVIFSKLWSIGPDKELHIDRIFLPESRIYICAEHLRGNET